MKTFREFYNICEGQKRKLKDIIGRGVPSERNPRTTVLGRRRQVIDITPLNQATYQGRAEVDRDPTRKSADNPDYTGQVKGAGSGTRDRMPGTTPSSSPFLPRPGSKGTSPARPLGKKPTKNWV